MKFNYKKSYGQNFINSKKIIHDIVEKSNILPNSLVIEIGPGSGSLTKELSLVAKNVIAYEIDTRLEDILDENLIDCHNVKIIYNDFLQCNIADDIKEYTYDNIYIVADPDMARRELAAQYPEQEILGRLAVMRDFGSDGNARLLDMWEQVRTNALPLWGIIVLAVEALAGIGFGVYLIRHKVNRKKYKKLRAQ